MSYILGFESWFRESEGAGVEVKLGLGLWNGGGGCGMSWRGREREVCQKRGLQGYNEGYGVDWQGGEGRGSSEACQKECWIDFSSSNQGLVSGLRGGSKMGMVVRERRMAETEVMELNVGIPKIEGCCQWVSISATSMIGMLIKGNPHICIFPVSFRNLTGNFWLNGNQISS
ncbi:hypothetical protein TB2_038704 [Malus domestica]|uniref:Uncharacterized protein n=1 Tax=Malus domestica TaxID=3750 RepID=A0A498JJJ0_MALDO|nr:hypothetical protein DVH24_008599 [Malus domestica]